MQKKNLLILTGAIGDLEAKHKQSLDIETAAALLDLQKKLQSILNLKAQKILFAKRGSSMNTGTKRGNSS